MQFLLPDVTYILHNKNLLLNKFSPLHWSTGIPFRMVMQHEMIIYEFCRGGEMRRGENFSSGSRDRVGLQSETGHCPRCAAEGWLEPPVPFC